MWRTTRILVVVLPLLVALNVRAEDQSGQTLETPSAETPAETTPNRQVPQEPGPAPGAAPVTDLVGYKPIPNSMLPVDVAPGTPAPTAHPTNIPVQSNLGGAVMMPMGPYTLGRDDVVHIAVQGQPEFTSTYVIGPDGSIQYGFLGDVKADGLTKEQLRDVLVERLKKFVRVPTVQVTILGFNSKAGHILGNVARPGKYAMRGDSIKIRDAVIAAGFVTEHTALSRVLVIKSDPKDPTVRTFNLKNVLYKGKMKDNIDLVTGDIVVVPETVWGVLTGFVNSLTNPASKAGTVAALAAL